MASAVRVMLPSEPAPSASASRSIKRRRLSRNTDVVLKAAKPPRENAASANETMTREDDESDIDDENEENEENCIKKTGSRCRGAKCAECGERFQFATELVAHSQKTRHQPFACQHDGCDKRYSKQEHLTRHVETAHVRRSTQSVEERKPFKCELCQARFTYNHGLTRHMKRSHRNVNLPFECSVCLKGFKKKSDLQAHTYVHTGLLPFECEDCGERFLKRFLLNRHCRTHEVNKEADTQVYVCDCGEICFDEEELNSHKQTEHSSGQVEDIVDGAAEVKKETPAHVCLVCDQTFARKQYLRAHLRTHFESLDDRKQYTCPMDGCDKAYTRKSNLMTHYNAVHDKRKSQRFACPREGCTARFGYKKVLNHHIESIHDNPKPPKRRERKSAGILERALGMSQIGEQIKRSTASTDDD